METVIDACILQTTKEKLDHLWFPEGNQHQRVRESRPPYLPGDGNSQTLIGVVQVSIHIRSYLPHRHVFKHTHSHKIYLMLFHAYSYLPSPSIPVCLCQSKDQYLSSVLDVYIFFHEKISISKWTCDHDGGKILLHNTKSGGSQKINLIHCSYTFRDIPETIVSCIAEKHES